MSEKLKACPFCGEAVRLITEPWQYIHCMNCHMEFGIHKVDHGISDRWNTRPIEDALRAELEQARGLLSAIYGEAELCNNASVRFQLVQWLMQKTAEFAKEATK